MKEIWIRCDGEKDRRELASILSDNGVFVRIETADDPMVVAIPKAHFVIALVDDGAVKSVETGKGGDHGGH